MHLWRQQVWEQQQLWQWSFTLDSDSVQQSGVLGSAIVKLDWKLRKIVKMEVNVTFKHVLEQEGLEDEDCIETQ